MTANIGFTAKFPNIPGENLREFLDVLSLAIAAAAEEPGNLQYDCYINGDKTACVVRELYADSAAVLAHMVGMSDLLPRLIELAEGFEADCYGSPSPELVEALGGVPVYGPVSAE